MSDKMYGLLGVMGKAGCNQKKLASILGISENTVSKIINKKVPLTTDKIRILCDYFHITDPVQKADIFLQ